MTVNDFPVTVYGDDEVAIQTELDKLLATRGVVYLTRRELLAMLAMLDAVAHAPPPPAAPTCAKCGTPKANDLFKGPHCPRCNDWV